MNYDRVRYPEVWAALFFAFAFVSLMTMPTGSPAVVAHLLIAVAGLVAACVMASIVFERQGY
jgi:hypothetical protein